MREHLRSVAGGSWADASGIAIRVAGSWSIDTSHFFNQVLG